MTTMTVQLRSIPGTQAAVGWAEGHTIVVDRQSEDGVEIEAMLRPLDRPCAARE